MNQTIRECHKPYFVGFEVWPSSPTKKRPKKKPCHKPYFVGFEVWLFQNPKILQTISLSQTLFCWIWGLTRISSWQKKIFLLMSQTLFCWIWGLTFLSPSIAGGNKMSQTLFCWIWGLTLALRREDVILEQCHKPYFVGFEVWPPALWQAYF